MPRRSLYVHSLVSFSRGGDIYRLEKSELNIKIEPRIIKELTRNSKTLTRIFFEHCIFA